MVLLDSRTGTITRKEPVGTGYIIDFTAPAEAEAGSTVVITTNVYSGAWGDYYNYIVDAATGEVIDSTVIYVAAAGNYTFTNDFLMPDKDLSYRIEYYDEPPVGYPVPLGGQ